MKQDGDSQVQVHVGFLQTNHKYEIQFDVPNLACGGNVSSCEKVSKDVKLEVANIEPTGKLYIRPLCLHTMFQFMKINLPFNRF